MGATIFISYSHKDKEALEQLRRFLTPLEWEGRIEVWADTDIETGDDWRARIDQALADAKVAVLFISQDFLASEFIRNQELPTILAAQDRGALTILPVFLSPSNVELVKIPYTTRSDDKAEATLAGLQGYGTPQEPLSDLSRADRDRVYSKLSKRLLELLDKAGQGEAPGPRPVSNRGPLDNYYQQCIDRWSRPRYELNKRFVKLSLLLDQGEDAQGVRWQVSKRKFNDLAQVLDETPEQALVVLGPPGSGKSTLLRHFELELARGALGAPAGGERPVSLFVSLSRYKNLGVPPIDWLAAQWHGLNPALPAFDKELAGGRMTLLLDGLNEIPVEHGLAIEQWREFLQWLEQLHPNNRVIFSCRSLDYSAPLSSKDLRVPQVRIEALADDEVQAFLHSYMPIPEHAAALWANLEGSAQLDLFRLPYYLKLLLAQTQEGEVPDGRAALFSGFIRAGLRRELEWQNPLFQSGDVLDPRDRSRFAQVRDWKTPFDLPDRSTLIQKLAELAFKMQEQGMAGESVQVRIDEDEAIAILDHAGAEAILKAGVALGVLDLDQGREEVLYVHQTLQEYFAARRLACAPQPGLVGQAWRADQVAPGLEQTLTTLADSDPMPPLPGTGWEETTLLAAAMAASPDEFVTELMRHNLALAGRCAAQPDVDISEALEQRLCDALVARTEDAKVDLRARIAAGLALGEVGDRRFERGRGPDGNYLIPPLVEIPGGKYSIGSDEGLYEDEAPVHDVKVGLFRIAEYPVTNAEWRLFQTSGYDDECWWDTQESKAWRRGEGTADGPKRQWREYRKGWQKNPSRIGELHSQGRITSKQAEDWEQIAAMGAPEFETLLEEWYPPGRQTQPRLWNDASYNNLAQPVVGVCWHEARAYCAWISAQTGLSYRLPTEAEWEAAAAGPDKRRFAYGNTHDPARCNTFETHIRRTTPAGVFPGGCTPEGLVDMTGNTWDWTSSLYNPYPYAADDGRESMTSGDGRRVLRGGSWYYLQVSARAAYRNYGYPEYRFNNVGFRLCSSSPIL